MAHTTACEASNLEISLDFLPPKQLPYLLLSCRRRHCSTSGEGNQDRDALLHLCFQSWLPPSPSPNRVMRDKKWKCTYFLFQIYPWKFSTSLRVLVKALPVIYMAWQGLSFISEPQALCVHSRSLSSEAFAQDLLSPPAHPTAATLPSFTPTSLSHPFLGNLLPSRLVMGCYSLYLFTAAPVPSPVVNSCGIQCNSC